MDELDELKYCIEQTRYYESIGLMDYSTEYAGLAFREVLKVFGTDARLIEICDAEREGRLVVLPCRVGDTIYQIVFGKEIYESKISEFRVEIKSLDGNGLDDCNYASDVGKTVFMNEPAAREAMKGDAE